MGYIHGGTKSGAEASREPRENTPSNPDSGGLGPILPKSNGTTDVWDPALEALRHHGIDGLIMTPQWELSRAVR